MNPMGLAAEKTTLREGVDRAHASQIAMEFVGERLRRQFEEHRHEHPEIYRELLVLARKAKGMGYRKFGIDRLFSVLRWERGPRDPDAKGFKLDNDMRAYYARALMEENEELRGFFRTRHLRSV